MLSVAFLAISCSNATTEESNTASDETSKQRTMNPLQDAEFEQTTENFTETTAAGSPNDWDKAIDEYEGYIDQYVKVLKKSKSGDMTALAESAELMEQAESAEKRLEAAKDQGMTTEQIKRFMKLQSKIIDAM